MKTKSKILIAAIVLSLFYSCATIKYPDHDYYDRLVTGVTKNSYEVIDIYGRNCPKIRTENPDSTRVGQWLTLKDEFKNVSR